MIYKSFVKRLIDLLLAIIALIIALPVLFFVIILLALVNQGNPVFIQSRPGRNGKIFKLIKFRTMNDKRDSNGNLLHDSERLTSLGNFIRKISLDELPQLINVLKGDMSLIGPRPLLIDYLSLYNDFQKRRHEVKPGITGWAQVNGRNTISWEQKFKFDIWYVDNMSFIVDFKIILNTIIKVIKKDGINKEEMISMDRFMGN